jgi:hypothetical protein
VGGLAGIPLIATAYGRVASRRALRADGRLFVRTRVEAEIVSDLVDLVRRVHGRAVQEGSDSISVPVPAGVDEPAVYRELSVLLARWEANHPDVRVEIVSPRAATPEPDERRLNGVLHGAIKERWRTKSG